MSNRNARYVWQPHRFEEVMLLTGHTCASVAEAIGSPARTVQYWYAGERNPRGERLLRLCDLFGVTAHHFYTLEPR